MSAAWHTSMGPPAGHGWLDQRSGHLPFSDLWRRIGHEDLSFTQAFLPRPLPGFRRCPWQDCDRWHSPRSRRCRNCGGRLGFWGTLHRVFTGSAQPRGSFNCLRDRETILRKDLTEAQDRLIEIDSVGVATERDSRDRAVKSEIVAGLESARAKLRSVIEAASDALWAIAVLRWFNRVEPFLGARLDLTGPNQPDQALYRYLVARRDQAEAIAEVWGRESRHAQAKEHGARTALNQAMKGLNDVITGQLAARAAAAVEGARDLAPGLDAAGDRGDEVDLGASWHALAPSKEALERLADQILLVEADAELDHLLG